MDCCLLGQFEITEILFLSLNNFPKRRNAFFIPKTGIREFGTRFFALKKVSDESEYSFEVGKWNPRRRTAVFHSKIGIRNVGKQFGAEKKESDNSDVVSIIFCMFVGANF